MKNIWSTVGEIRLVNVVEVSVEMDTTTYLMISSCQPRGQSRAPVIKKTSMNRKRPQFLEDLYIMYSRV